MFNNKPITVEGVNYPTLSEAAKRYNLPAHKVFSRLYRLGWSIEETFELVPREKEEPLTDMFDVFCNVSTNIDEINEFFLRFKKFRKELKITQKDLATFLNSRQDVYSRLESKNQDISNCHIMLYIKLRMYLEEYIRSEKCNNNEKIKLVQVLYGNDILINILKKQLNIKGEIKTHNEIVLFDLLINNLTDDLIINNINNYLRKIPTTKWLEKLIKIEYDNILDENINM